MSKKFFLKKRIRNAMASFHPGEVNYTMAIGTFGGFEVAHRAGTADESVIAHSFDNDIFLTGVPEYVPSPGDTVLDIGAHIGTFAMLVASRIPSGRVHAIEASQETYNYLRLNGALNPTLPITAHHLALTDHEGEVTLHHDRGNWGHSIVKQLSPRGEKVQAASLATFVRDNDVDQIAFIKFNCEGAEFPILHGAPIELLRKIDKMLILYHLDLADGYTLQGLLDRLTEAGFKNKVLEKRSTRGWIIAEQG